MAYNSPEMMGVFEFVATDPDEFRERIQPVGDPDRVRAVGRRFHSTVRAVPLRNLGLAYLRIGGGEVVFEGSRDYGLTVSLGDPIAISDALSSTELAAGIAQATTPESCLSFSLPRRHAVLTCQLDADWVESEAARARCDLDIRQRVSARRGAGSELMRVLIGVFRDFERSPSLHDDQRAVQKRESRLLDLYLRAACDHDDARDGLSSTIVSRAEEFMLAHLEARAPVTRVAEAAQASLRTLHRAFRNHYGIGPSRWLRERRLDAVHRELFAAAPDQTTVTEVALRFGFDHLGRFGQQYRRSFGELPSETLAS